MHMHWFYSFLVNYRPYCLKQNQNRKYNVDDKILIFNGH